MYAIDGLLPSGIPMGGYGFCIYLSPEFREGVKASGVQQGHVDRLISIEGQEWLQKCGYSHYFDPENSGHGASPTFPSPETRPSYRPNEIRVAWGEWGPEHISVPGNACGLGINQYSCGNPFKGGTALLPHNVDCWSQVLLLLITFTRLASTVLWIAGSDQPIEPFSE